MRRPSGRSPPSGVDAGWDASVIAARGAIAAGAPTARMPIAKMVAPTAAPARLIMGAVTRRPRSQWPAEHAQADGESPEPARLVEGERGLIVELGVDQSPVNPVTGQPTQPIGDDNAPPTFASSARCHGESLEISLLTGATADRVRSDSVVAGDAEASGRGSADRVVEAHCVESPKIIEGKAVESEDSAMVGRAGATGRARGRRDAGHVVSEQMQALADCEPSVDERKRIGGGQRTGDHSGAALLAEGLQAAFDELGRRGAAGAYGEVGDIIVASPRPHSDPTAPPSQRLFGRHPLGASVHPPILTEGPSEAGSQRG